MTTRPGPPPTWTTTVVHPPLRPGADVPLEVHVSSSDGFDLELQLAGLPPELRPVDGATPSRLHFTGRGPAVQVVRLVLAVSPDAPPGTELCLRLRQRATNGGVPDVVELQVRATVQ